VVYYVSQLTSTRWPEINAVKLSKHGDLPRKTTSGFKCIPEFKVVTPMKHILVTVYKIDGTSKKHMGVGSN
jgi:hypothetical protein